MAVTAFWPVKGDLKPVIDYAENPDKTTPHKYMDDELASVLQYAENKEKTDRKMFVTGINCEGETAYEEMMAVKRRYGKLSGNVAYHGYQSFKPGEVTPEECHAIGVATARQMFGADYQVVVTTHLNTTSVHNHIVCNSVSFRTGRKFENHISDHFRLREISDEICREHRLSVLENAPFYDSQRKTYWLHKAGRKTHRDILWEDVEYCLGLSASRKEFITRLTAMGYQFDPVRFSVKAPSWERAIRLDRLGYPEEEIEERLFRNPYEDGFYAEHTSTPPYRPRNFPLIQLERQLKFTVEHTNSFGLAMLDLMFLIFLQLLHLTEIEDAERKGIRPLSPELRMELQRLDEYSKMNELLARYDIHTGEELLHFEGQTQQVLTELEQERQSYRNQLRRCKNPERADELKAKAREVSRKMKPLREQLKTARKIEERTQEIQKLLAQEKQMEIEAQQRNRQKNRNRSYNYER